VPPDYWLVVTLAVRPECWLGVTLAADGNFADGNLHNLHTAAAGTFVPARIVAVHLHVCVCANHRRRRFKNSLNPFRIRLRVCIAQ